jgi:sigma-B regulation protein RsbU (phosphoserine phosphatase)
MQLATEVQQMFIPDSLPKEEKYQLDSIYKPHFKIGGDYFDYFYLNPDEFIFCIADVSGKGVGAAMLMANFQALLHSMVPKYEDLGELVAELNRAVFTITKSDKFITFFICKVNIKRHHVKYVNAGHCPVLYSHSEGQEFWYSSCTVLGAVPNLKGILCSETKYLPGAIIMAYTDGLTELANAAGDFFDEDHLWAFGFTYHDLSAEKFNKTLLGRLDSFRGEQEYHDDIAVVTCKLS